MDPRSRSIAVALVLVLSCFYSNLGSALDTITSFSILSAEKDIKGVVIVPVIAGIITSAICAFFVWRWMAKRKALKDKSKFLLQDLPLFNFEKLATATNNFHLTNKLGQGGFGPVYEGELKDGIKIAVKRLEEASGRLIARKRLAGLLVDKEKIPILA